MPFVAHPQPAGSSNAGNAWFSLNRDWAMRAVVKCLVCFGFVAGPLMIAILIALPLGILAAGKVYSDPVVQSVGAVLLCLHGLAICALLRARGEQRTGRQLVELSSTGTPELFALIASLAERIGPARIDRVLIGTELNASLAQTPVWFGLGGHKSELTIGLPLLMTLDEQELRAVIAHELAHARQSDGSVHAELYRVRSLWQRLSSACENTSFVGRGSLRWFARGYLRVLERYAGYVLRAGEFAADAAAGNATSAATLSRALLRTQTARSELDQHWSTYWLSNVTQAKPMRGPWQTLSQTLQDTVPTATKNLWPKVLADEVSVSPSHPSLHARLARLGLVSDQDVCTLELQQREACALQILGKAGATVISHFDRIWWHQNRVRWASFHATVAHQKARLAILDDAAARGKLTLATAIERAARAEYLLGHDPALARYRWCIAQFPTHPQAHERLGDYMLRCGDPAGQAFVDHAQTLFADPMTISHTTVAA